MAEMVRCSACGGSGKSRISLGGWSGTGTCIRCGGSGQVPGYHAIQSEDFFECMNGIGRYSHNDQKRY